jgi:hypothetical protein
VTIKTQHKTLFVSAILIAATVCWFYFAFAARYSSTRNIESTSAFSAPEDLMIGSACVLIFIAAGLSLLRQRAAAVIVRVLVALLSVAGVALTAHILLDFQTYLGSSSLHPHSFTVGCFLLIGYFVATLLPALPGIPVWRILRYRYILHFGVFPSALCIIFFFAFPPDYYWNFANFGIYLVAGLPFILLSFHMYELRQTFDRNV